MIRSVDVTLAGRSGDNSDCHVVVEADNSDIGAVELLDRNRETLLVDQAPDCADRYDFTWSISNRRLPIYVRVRPCGATETRPDPYGPFVEPPPGALPCDPAAGLPPSAECTAALRAIEERNQAIRDNCAGIANHQRRLRNDLDTALILHGLAVAAGIAVAVLSLLGPLGATFVTIAVAVIASLAAAEAILLADAVIASAERNSAIEADATLRAGGGARWNAAVLACCPHELAGVERVPPPCGP